MIILKISVEKITHRRTKTLETDEAEHRSVIDKSILEEKYFHSDFLPERCIWLKNSVSDMTLLK